MLAQLALLWAKRDIIRASNYSIDLLHDCDNMGAVSSANKLFTTKAPMCYIVQSIASWATILRCNVSLNHLPGALNDWADMLSRDNIGFIQNLNPAHRINVDIGTLLHF